MRKRLFVAIVLPPELIDAYVDYRRLESGRWPGARWAAAENLHITVCFLGGVEEAEIPVLMDELGRSVSLLRPFCMAHQAVVLAPPGRRPPTMLWAAFSGNEPYAAAAKSVRAAVGRLAPEMASEKELLPHVTLARFKDRAPVSRGAAASQLRQTASPFEVNELQLIESRLHPSGPVYSLLKRFSFKTSNKK